jgi:hypothetical protein
VNRFLTLALVCACGTAAADPAPQPQKTAQGMVERARLEVQPGGKPIKELSIDNPLGDVKVIGYDGASLMIETRKVGPDEEALDRLRVSLVPNGDGTVRIATTADGGAELKKLARSAVRIDLIVRAPRAARVEAVASAGALDVENMDAGGDLDTASGPISVRNLQGELSTHTVSGATSLAQVFGSVDAQTLASDLQLDTIGGERLFASANRGKIAGRRVRAREVELTTVDGKIVLEAEAPLRGHLVVASLRGDVDVQLRRRGAVRIRAHAVKLDLGAASAGATARPDGWVESQLGELAAGTLPALVELRSSYGNVQFAIVE